MALFLNDNSSCLSLFRKDASISRTRPGEGLSKVMEMLYANKVRCFNYGILGA